MTDGSGEHETRADVLDDPALQVEEYLAAIQLADDNDLPTLSIRISLSRVLLEDFSDPRRAAAQLATCEPEMVESVDKHEKKEWADLFGRCNVSRER